MQEGQLWETRVYEDRHTETDEVTLEDNLATQKTLAQEEERARMFPSMEIAVPGLKWKALRQIPRPSNQILPEDDERLNPRYEEH